MDGLLTAVKTVSRNDQSSLVDTGDSHGPDSEAHTPKPQARPDTDPTSADYILEVLKSKPDSDHLFQVLATLDPSSKEAATRQFDIRLPSPTTAQILQVLVSTTIPDHWDSLKVKPKDAKSRNAKIRAALLRCLCSVAGVSSLVAQLRTLITAARSSAQHAEGSSYHLQTRDILAVLSALLKPHDFILRLYADISSVYDNGTKVQVAWKEFISLIASSKVLSIAAEALTIDKVSSDSPSVSWVGEGHSYATWLGQNICFMVSKTDPNNQEWWKAIGSLTSRALSLGYTEQLVREFYSGLLVDQSLPSQFALLLDGLRQTGQIAVLEVSFRDIQRKHFSDEVPGFAGGYQIPNETVRGVATLLSMLIGERPQLEGQIADWLSAGQGGSIHTIGLRRAILTNFASREDAMRTLFARGLEQFGDKFYIKHSPMRSQEANTQVVLLAAGYVSRLDASAVRDIGHSGVFLNAVSNRLAAASTKARFLGMIVGTAISQLIEQPGKAMRFDLEEMDSDEAQWYLSLIKTKDDFGSLDAVKPQKDETRKTRKADAPSATSVARTQPPMSQQSKIVSIEEVDDSGDEEDHAEEIPYENPDIDASDSDDDPTLVKRKKPTPPVYILDLIAYLRDTEDLERYQLAVTSAPSLIQRKTGFGTELLEHVTELALIVVGLQDEGKLPKFHEYRLQSMIALIAAQPSKMGNWFSAMFFDGDISQTQRSAILTALGLSARELAGHGEQDAQMLKLPEIPDTAFPSEKLPPNLEALYQNNESPIASLTKQLSQTSLQPLAANAADAASGPNALKVRTFSSRMEVEKKRQQRETQKQKSTIKDLQKVLAEGFFYPLKGRFEMMMMQFSSSTAPSYNPFFTPHLLCLFLQTLTLILSTAGPNTPFLAPLTQEALSLLLALHSRPLADDPTILSALLSLFLVTVDLNVASGTTGEERLVTDFAAQVLELREWSGEAFDRTPPAKGDDEPQQQARTLAAGVMVKLGEVMERYQGRLMGVNAGFAY